MKDARLWRFVVAHLLTVIGEWAAVVGVLVHAYGWGGSAAVGVVSLAVLAPGLAAAPLAAAATARGRSDIVRLVGFAIQAVAYGGATAAAAADAPTPVVAAFVVVGLGAVNTLRPSGAVMLPAIVRSTRELTTSNLAVSYGDSASALLGPLAAAGFAALGGPTAVFAMCTSTAVIAFGLSVWHRPELVGGHRPVVASKRSRGVMVSAVRELRDRPWSLGVVYVSAARNVVVGAFDVLLVIISMDTLDMGDGGPGLLTAIVGIGALSSAVITTIVVRRSRLSPTLLATLVVSGTVCVALGLWTFAAVVFIALPVLGVCLSSMDNMSRILLQRATDVRTLGPMFACLGVVASAGQLAGSALAQGLVAASGLRAALIGLGVLLVVLAVANVRSLRDADRQADVPVVEMALLAPLPMFAPLAADSLEAVARAGERLPVPAGANVIVQGEAGQTFYVVSDGEFDVVMSGEHIRTAERGGFFGEVALLSNVPRTATVTARCDGELLTIDRGPFLLAVTGHDIAYNAASDHVRGLRFDPGTVLDLHPPDPALQRAGDPGV